MCHRDLRDLEATEPLRQYFFYYSLFVSGKVQQNENPVCFGCINICAHLSRFRDFSQVIYNISSLEIYKTKEYLPRAMLCP